MLLCSTAPGSSGCSSPHSSSWNRSVGHDRQPCARHQDPEGSGAGLGPPMGDHSTPAPTPRRCRARDVNGGGATVASLGKPACSPLAAFFRSQPRARASLLTDRHRTISVRPTRNTDPPFPEETPTMTTTTTPEPPNKGVCGRRATSPGSAATNALERRGAGPGASASRPGPSRSSTSGAVTARRPSPAAQAGANVRGVRHRRQTHRRPPGAPPPPRQRGLTNCNVRGGRCVEPLAAVDDAFRRPRHHGVRGRCSPPGPSTTGAERWCASCGRGGPHRDGELDPRRIPRWWRRSCGSAGSYLAAAARKASSAPVTWGIEEHNPGSRFMAAGGRPATHIVLRARHVLLRLRRYGRRSSSTCSGGTTDRP